MAKYFIQIFLSGGAMVKKWWMIMLLAAVLTGCANVQELETMNDDFVMPEAVPGRVLLDLPGDAGEEALCGSADRQLYICENYTIGVQVLPGGDMKRTLQTVTGFEPSALTVVQTQKKGLDSFQTVWTAAGEGGDQLGRAEILSDGNFHYVLSVMADSTAAGTLAEPWQCLFESFGVSYIG
jgi:hypothetical protein